MINSLKITIIIVYNNPWPEWFNYFLLSCENNKPVNWLIFSENDSPGQKPANVRFIKISLQDLSHRIKEQIGIIPDIVHPFKFSDFKPAYGLIFRDYLMESTFWGYCDADMVFGNIENFITEEVIENNDIISPSADFYPGHFLLIRNTEYLINLFKLAPDWRTILENPDCYCFDEKICLPPVQPDPVAVQKVLLKNVKNHLREYRFIRNPLFHFLKQNFVKTDIKKKININEIRDFNAAINYSRSRGNIRTLNQQWFADDIIKLRDRNKSYRIDWKEGKLFDGQNDILYFHFPLSKYNSTFRIIDTDNSSFSLINDHISL